MRRDRVGDVGAAHALEAALAAAHLGDAGQVVASQLGAAFADSFCNLDECVVHAGLLRLS